MKTLFIIIYAVLAIGCQEAEAVSADELLADFAGNALSAKRKYGHDTTVAGMTARIGLAGGMVGLVLWAKDGIVGCVVGKGEITPLSWDSLGVGDTAVFVGDYIGIKYKDDGIHVVFTNCKDAVSI